MDRGTMIIKVNEPLKSIDASKLRLAGSFSVIKIKGEIFTKVDQSSDMIWETEFTAERLNLIKAEKSLANENTKLCFEPGLAIDKSNMDSLGIACGAIESPKVTLFTPDSTAPVVESFSLDMNTGDMTLKFSEAVDRDTFDATKITIQNQAFDSAHKLKEAGAVSSVVVHPPTLVLRISAADLNAIKGDSSLAISTESANLCMPLEGAFKDMSEVAVEAVGCSAASALAATTVVKDETTPILNSSLLDMDKGIVELTFSEPLREESIVVSNFVLRSSGSVLSDNLRPSQLSKYYIRKNSSFKVLIIEFTEGDIASIKVKATIGAALNSSFFCTVGGHNEDMAKNEF
jgi:hypothetical protein